MSPEERVTELEIRIAHMEASLEQLTQASLAMEKVIEYNGSLPEGAVEITRMVLARGKSHMEYVLENGAWKMKRAVNMKTYLSELGGERAMIIADSSNLTGFDFLFNIGTDNRSG